MKSLSKKKFLLVPVSFCIPQRSHHQCPPLLPTKSSESGYPFQCTRYSFLPRQSLKSLISSTSHWSSSGITGGGLVGSREGNNSGSLGTYLRNSLAWNTG